MPSYKDTNDYLKYFNGEYDGRDHKRLADLPPFKFNQDNEVKLAPGEVYCRFGGKSGSITCIKDVRFSSESNLKNHIKKHKLNGVPVKVKGRKAGANSVENNDEATDFYDKLLGYAAGALSEGDIQTPSKKRKAQTPPPLLRVPMRKRGQDMMPHLTQMRKDAGLPPKGKYAHCAATKKKTCPSMTRDPDCEVWARFEVDNDTDEEGI